MAYTTGLWGEDRYGVGAFYFDPIPVADFTATPTSGASPLSVQFTDSSQYATSWFWNFGDGSTSSTQNPLHVYSTTGTYTVILSAINLAGMDVETKTGYIAVGANPSADFSATPISGVSSSTINFTNLSISATSYIWNFGDGYTSSTTSTADLYHQYNTTGTFNVILTAINTIGTDVETKLSYITIGNIPTANFSATPITSAYAPLTVNFTNLSISATSYLWKFGDGYTSSTTNPVHTYSAVGNYTVELLAQNGYGVDVEIKTDYISIGAIPIADFSAYPVTGIPNVTVYFDNLSINAASYLWDFGDGYTSSTAEPEHVYTSAGLYTVILSATNSGTDVETKTSYITVSNIPISDFSATPTTGGNPLTVSFTNLSQYATSYLWNFGDGFTSSTTNPTHIYSSTGTYNVILIAINLVGMDVETKTNYISVASLGHIGAFYFGPEYEIVDIDNPLTLSAIVVQPTILATSSYSASFNKVYPIHLYINVQQPTVYAFKDINVDFIGEPLKGSSPLCVKFTALVTFLGNYKTNIKEYYWYWDYENNPTVYEVSTSPVVYHAFRGRANEKYSVKLCVVLES